VKLHLKLNRVETLKKNALIVGLVLLFFMLSVRAYALENEPDGFRGIKWGMDISKLEDLRHLSTMGSGAMLYKRLDDVLEMDGAKLEKIDYCFWGNKFCAVYIHAKGYSNWTALKRTCFRKFGACTMADDFLDIYDWDGETTVILLKYDKSLEKTLFQYAPESF
jgi:hypothetical protein